MKPSNPSENPENWERTVVLSYADITHLMDKVYNRAIFNSDFTEDDFFDEWKAVYNDVLQGLQIFGVCADFGDSDFSMGPPQFKSRSIGVCFDTIKLARPEVLNLLNPFCNIMSKLMS